jgi:hypothetical protein
MQKQKKEKPKKKKWLSEAQDWRIYTKRVQKTMNYLYITYCIADYLML